MKVTLLKKADYEFKPENMTAMPFGIFNTLMKVESKNEDELPLMVAFNNRDEYEKKASEFAIDETKEVYINEKGQIFCFLR